MGWGGARAAKIAIMTGVLGGSLGGCDRTSPSPTTKPTTAPAVAPKAPAPAVEMPFAKGYDEWTQAEAIERLDNEELAVSAAVRLVRLSGRAPLCVPEVISPRYARGLSVAKLSAARFALGFSGGHERRLRAPVLISTAGDVFLPVSEFEEEVAVLHVAKDADVFPHLIITPTHVLWVSDSIVPALVGKRLPHVAFRWADADGYPYAALWLSRAAGEPIEVARYTWDPYEFAFMGPLIDKLPDPPGGRFELDLSASQALVPVGGEIPEPEPLPEPENQPPPELPPF